MFVYFFYIFGIFVFVDDGEIVVGRDVDFFSDLYFFLIGVLRGFVLEFEYGELFIVGFGEICGGRKVIYKYYRGIIINRI